MFLCDEYDCMKHFEKNFVAGLDFSTYGDSCTIEPCEIGYLLFRQVILLTLEFCRNSTFALKVHQCRFENLPMFLCSCENFAENFTFLTKFL